MMQKKKKILGRVALVRVLYYDRISRVQDHITAQEAGFQLFHQSHFGKNFFFSKLAKIFL